MDIGLNVNVHDYTQWLSALSPSIPAFSRIYVPPRGKLPEFGQAATIVGLPVGTIPWISHKDPLPLSVVADYWDTLPRLAGARDRYRWTYAHEAAPLTPQGAREFRNYWARLVEMHAEHPRAGEIELVDIQTAYALRFQPDVNFRDYVIPGITFGLDCYPRAFGDGYEPPESLFALAETVHREYGVDWCVPELGAEPRAGENRAVWFRDALEYLRGAGCTAVGLWCGTETRSRVFYDYRPDTATLAVWKVAIGTPGMIS